MSQGGAKQRRVKNISGLLKTNHRQFLGEPQRHAYSAVSVDGSVNFSVVKGTALLTMTDGNIDAQLMN